MDGLVTVVQQPQVITVGDQPKQAKRECQQAMKDYAVTWPNEPEVIQKTLDNKQTVQRLSSLEWFLQGPEAEWLQMPPAKLCPISQQWSHHKELFVELITVMSLRGFVVGCFCVLLFFFLKVKTAKNCKNEFLSR